MISIQKRVRGMWWTDVTEVMMMGVSWCHTLAWFLVLECRGQWDFLLTLGWVTGSGMHVIICLWLHHVRWHHQASSETCSPLALKKQAAVLWAVTCRGPPRKEGGFWLTTSKKRSISTTPHQELSVASDHVSLGVGPSPAEPQMRLAATVDH